MIAERTWQPGARGQYTSVVVTIVLAAGLAFGLPWLANATAPKDTEITAGDRVEAGGVSIVAAAGWALNAGTPLLAMNKGDAATLLLITPGPDATSPSDVVTEQAAGFTTGKVGEIVAFTTASGLNGVLLPVDDGKGVTVLIAITDGTNLSRGQASVPTSGWEASRPELETMLKTVEFSAVAPA